MLLSRCFQISLYIFQIMGKDIMAEQEGAVSREGCEHPSIVRMKLSFVVLYRPDIEKLASVRSDLGIKEKNALCLHNLFSQQFSV